MSNTYTGHLTCARTNTDEMWLHLTDDATHCEVLRLKMSLEDFARIITGQGDRPCVFLMRAEHLGKVVEHKVETVHYAHQSDGRAAKAAALAPFEVDGWRGEPSDLGNMHRGGAHDGYQVRFTRYVARKEEC